MKLNSTSNYEQVGFSPHVHFITAWNSTAVNDIIRDRLFCERTGSFVPYSTEEHSPEITSLLSIKVRRSPSTNGLHTSVIYTRLHTPVSNRLQVSKALTTAPHFQSEFITLSVVVNTSTQI